MNKQISNLITFSFECTKYIEDHITKKPCLLKKEWVLYKNSSRICLSLSTLNSQCMQSLCFYFTIRLWTRTEVYVIFPWKILLYVGNKLVGQVVRCPVCAQLFTLVCHWMLYLLKFQVLCLVGLRYSFSIWKLPARLNRVVSEKFSDTLSKFCYSLVSSHYI